MNVTLTIPEWHAAVQLAVMRMVASDAQRLNNASTYARSLRLRLDQEVVGAAAEYAVAKALGVFYSGTCGTFHNDTDMPNGIEVRGTSMLDGCLILRDNDPPDRAYVLVTGEAPTLVIRGWIAGSDCRVREWQRDPGGRRLAWFVPQDALCPWPKLVMALNAQKELASMRIDMTDPDSVREWIAVHPQRHLAQLRSMWRLWPQYREVIEAAVLDATPRHDGDGSARMQAQDL
jgi:hypothetical protein